MDTPTTNAAPTPSAAPATPAPAVLLTAAALAQVKKVIQDQGFQGYLFSIRVVPAGCSGLGYDLNMVREAKPQDILWEQDGVKLTTDALSSQYLSGTEIDFVTSVTGAGFKFNNPNAKSSCGCGTSFTT
ncbi:HesB/IscA family protein [[Archangium] primigenium]|jgi:iron-sulfur cluster assembly protein|uniref:HesB/IscA family protein n=1 Tax=Melittangium TaxID=44 RepID=UPI00195B9207|nr:iron-sulfur cluster assembly accessory protein [Archangium primigenium]MBM7114870.1 iron-sulfur cluster assembly accessory protein [Archangium primigenium]